MLKAVHPFVSNITIFWWKWMSFGRITRNCPNNSNLNSKTVTKTIKGKRKYPDNK